MGGGGSGRRRGSLPPGGPPASQVWGVWGGPAFGAAVGSALQPCRAVSCSLTSLDLRPLGGGPGVSTWGSPGWASAPLVDRGLCFGWGSPRGRIGHCCSGSQVGPRGRGSGSGSVSGCWALSPCPVWRGARCLPDLSPSRSGRPDPIGHRPRSWGSLLRPLWPLNRAWRRPPAAHLGARSVCPS